MSPHEKSWQRLLAAARRAPAHPDDAAPYGFAARVAAQAFDRAPAGSGFARFSLRAALVACAVAAAAVAANYSAITGAFTPDVPAAAVTADDDPVAEVVNLGS